MDFKHISVLFDEVMDLLQPEPGKVFVDGTVGGGGHSYGFMERLGPTGRLIAIDQDVNALEAAKERLKPWMEQITFVQDNFENLPQIIDEYAPEGVDGILLDIGVSSPQIDNAERGFSYMADAPLDMRMNQNQALTAQEIVNTWSENEIRRVLQDYGEENWSARIAKLIVEHRAKKPIETTLELVDIIERAIPKGAREKGSHVAKRTFQGLRIAVNDELGVLERMIDGAIERLNKGGRMGIITFHSLEDRIVKNKFRYHSLKCICPPELPICQCNKIQTVKVIIRKPVEASTLEKEKNSRSRSAKLRVVEKIV